MRKIISPLFLILVAALIIAGAFLPHMTAAVTDHMTNEKPHCAPMQSVQLDFGSDHQSPESILQKLAMRDNMYTVPISAAEATMTEEEVYAATEQYMQEYADAGIFRWFDITYRMTETHLCIDPDNPKYSNIIWTVNLVQESPYYNLFLHLDDETGKILYIDYVNQDTKNYMFMPKDQPPALEALTEIYFRQLGLTDTLENNDSMGISVEELATTDEATGMHYHFEHSAYGDFNINFLFYPNGFYISFPN